MLSCSTHIIIESVHVIWDVALEMETLALTRA